MSLLSETNNNNNNNIIIGVFNVYCYVCFIQIFDILYVVTYDKLCTYNKSSVYVSNAYLKTK